VVCPAGMRKDLRNEKELAQTAGRESPEGHVSSSDWMALTLPSARACEIHPGVLLFLSWGVPRLSVGQAFHSPLALMRQTCAAVAMRTVTQIRGAAPYR
jgi:hypothetical protein